MGSMIAVGNQLPPATLFESTSFTEACPAKPERVQAAEAAKGKRIVIFGLPGAFTATCSSQHLPGFLRHYEEFRRKGIDAIWCVSVNDGYVMAAWGREHEALDKVRFLGDGNLEFTRALGVEQDLSRSGMGLRSRRYSMLVEDGVVTRFHLEEPGKFEVSDAETLLRELA